MYYRSMTGKELTKVPIHKTTGLFIDIMLFMLSIFVTWKITVFVNALCTANIIEELSS